MPQALTTQQINQYISQVKSGGVEQARQVYDILNSQGYKYAGWAAGVARGDSITGVSALNFMQGTALIGMGGDACRNLTQEQIDKIRVDMATGYLQTLKGMADKSGNVVERDVNYKQTEKFHKDAFEKNNLTLDNWTLKAPMDFITQVEGNATVEKKWEILRDTEGTGLDALLGSSGLLFSTWWMLITSSDPDTIKKAQQWMGNAPGLAGWGQITRSADVFNNYLNFIVPNADKLVLKSLLNLSTSLSNTINSFYTTARNWVAPRDPLVLDLDGGGISTSAINPNAPIYFDQNGDGIRTATGWISAGEALVVRDLNGNGLIDSGRELFGDSTLLIRSAVLGQTAANGFAALADLDSDANGIADGQFNSQDTAFNSVRLWQDINQDGVSQANELHTFAELGVIGINVNGVANNINLGGGNSQALSGNFIRSDGQIGSSGTVSLVGSLLLVNNNFYRQFTDNPIITETAQNLPQMQGSGWVRDLREAMSLGTTQALALQEKITQFANTANRDAQKALIDSLLNDWADTTGSLVHSVYEYNLKSNDLGSGETTTDLKSVMPDTVLTVHPLGMEQTIDGAIGGTYTAPTEEGLQALHRLNVLEVFNGNKFFNILSTPASSNTGGIVASSGGSIKTVAHSSISI